MVLLRTPQPADAEAISVLFAQLGYTLSAETIRERLLAVAGSATDPVLLAGEGEAVVGLIALHCSQMLHAARPVARITTLVVHENTRGHGVGRRLLEAAIGLAERAGCEAIELTTALHRTEAQRFYRANGFIASSWRLHRTLG